MFKILVLLFIVKLYARSEILKSLYFVGVFRVERAGSIPQKKASMKKKWRKRRRKMKKGKNQMKLNLKKDLRY